MFWILATFVCLLLDRQTARRRLAANVMKIVDAHGESGLQKVVFGPGSGLHLWRLAAGICAGAAVAVKWNSLFFIAAMGVLTVFWDMNARRILGLKKLGYCRSDSRGYSCVHSDDWRGSYRLSDHLDWLV